MFAKYGVDESSEGLNGIEKMDFWKHLLGADSGEDLAVRRSRWVSGS